uniref:RNA-directed RNA polymerase L n=4 Tax=avian paramyxovirus 2 TaxID=2560313 RepID=A0A1Q2TSN5_9MONO|nr:large polymerase protein [Avian metaavulavirus 2]BAW94634.1 large polymerase protein [Avian metaavulavirus 2]
MDQTQADTIIQPEVHLNSPLVRAKLVLLWKLTGLPLPSDLRSFVLTTHAADDQIAKNETRIKAKINSLIDNLIKHCKARQVALSGLTPVVHPTTLQWLLSITCERADHLAKVREKSVKQAMSEKQHGFRHLFSAVSHQLVGNATLFCAQDSSTVNVDSPCSSGCERLIIDSIGALQTRWTRCRWAWLHIKQVMRYQVLQSRLHAHANSVSTWSEAWGFIGITPDIVLIVDYKSKMFTILTFEMMLMYSDVIEGRDNVVAVGSMSPNLQPVVERIEVLFDVVDTLARRIHDPIYDLVAALESMAYAAVQLHDASETHAGEFFSFNLTEIESTLAPLLDPGQVLSVMRTISYCYSGLSPDQAAELLCVMRLFGHPLLSAQQAAKKVRESMCAPKLLEHDAILQTLSFFKGIIINGYRKSHSGVWPAIDPDSIVDDDLRQLYYESAEISHAFMLKKYRYLSMIEFRKSIEFDLNDDLSTFLKDKAICRPKDQWARIFRKSLFPCKTNLGTSIDVKSNRLLIDFLESHDFNPEEEMKYVTTLAYLADNQFSASYSLKEKEIKTTGRIFAKMTRKMRSCQVILESLLSSHVCKFFKENGVSMEQLSLTKSLLAMSQLAPRISSVRQATARRQDPGLSHSNGCNHIVGDLGPHQQDRPARKSVVATFLTTDLQKYCLNWRYGSIKLFAQALNQLFGIEHGFEWIHLRLMNSTLFVGDPFSPPESKVLSDLDDAPNSDIFIVSARGGIEGLCQKLWTMISISIIHCVAEKIGARVAAMVQGDNQVIAITRELYKGETYTQIQPELDRLGNAFFAEFKRHNYAMGHNLKPKETIQSQSFFVYSKRIFWEGRILSQALKNATKLCFIADHLGDNTVSSCSNLASTITRLVENGYEKDTAFILNIISAMTQLLIDEQYSLQGDYSAVRKLIGSSNYRNLLVASLIPGQVGGYNFLNISRLFTRNIGDPVTCAIADLKWFIRSGLIPEFILKNILLRDPGDGGWSTLCADPYALNIPYTQLPTTYLKKHTQRALLSDSNNPLLAGVQLDNQYIEEEEFARFLLDRESVMPRVAHTIMESSILGKRKNIQGLIDTTPTIIKTALMRQPISRRKCDKIVNYSINYLTECHDSLLSCRTFEPRKEIIWESAMISVETCSVTIAEFLRATSWSNILNGRTISGVTSPDTIELLKGSLIGENAHCILCEQGDETFTWMHLAGPIYIPDPGVTASKMRVPYLGSKTEERRTASMATIKGMSHHLKAALRGASVLVWAFGDTEESWEHACLVANTRCKINLPQLRLLTPTPSSSNIQHRLNDGISVQKFTPASLSRVASFVHICNDFQKLERDGSSVDSNLIYQQIMLTGLSIMETLHPMHVSWVYNNQTIHLHTGTSCCPREIETSIVNPARGEFPTITLTTNNQFLFDCNPIHDEALTKLSVSEFKFQELNIDSMQGYSAVNLLSRCVAKLIGECILEDGIGSSIKNEAMISFDNSINWISEALNSDLRLVFLQLGQELLCDLAYQMYYLRVIGYHSIVAYLQNTLERIPVIQLANMALTISHPEVWRRVTVSGFNQGYRSPYLATVDFIAACRDIIVQGAQHYMADLLSGVECQYTFFNVQDGDLTPKMEQFLARRMCLFVLLTGTIRPLPIIRSLNAIEKCAILTQFLYYLPSVDMAVADKARVLYQLSINPKIDALVSNLYFTTRRLLSNIRGDSSSRAQIAFLYEEEVIVDVPASNQFDQYHRDPILRGGLFFSLSLKMERMSLNRFAVQTLPTQGSNSQGSRQTLWRASPLAHCLKSVGQVSTSWYKYAVVGASVEKVQPTRSTSLYIGEGSGSVMTLLEYLDPATIIFYNSLFSNSMNPPQRNFGLMPTQFQDSVVYKNISAGVDCKYGFKQVFQPLWRDVDQETNVVETAFLNYVMEVVPVHSSKRVVCEVEFDRGMPDEIVITGYIHVLMVTAYSLHRGGRLIIKVYRHSEAVFQFVLSAIVMMFGGLDIHRNSYMSTNKEEYIIIAAAPEALNYSSVPAILQRVKSVIDQQLTLISPIDLERLRHETESLREKENNLVISLTRGKYQLRPTQTDMLLSYLGGRFITLFGQSARDLMATDVADLDARKIALVDLLMVESNIILSESTDLDLALLLSPFNLDKGRKIVTLAKATTRQLLPVYIASEVMCNRQAFTHLTSIIQRGVIRIENMLATTEFVRQSVRPQFIKEVITIAQVNHLFSDLSKLVLSRSEVKQALKFVGCCMKFRNASN